MAATNDAEAVTTADRTPIVTNAEDGTLVLTWPDPKPRSIEIDALLLDTLIAEINRLHEHSVILNTVAWQISVALGDVGPDDERHESAGVEVDLKRLFVKFGVAL